MGAGGTDRGAAVETGRAGSWEWGTERPWGGTEELWHDDVGGQSDRVLVIRWELGCW